MKIEWQTPEEIRRAEKLKIPVFDVLFYESQEPGVLPVCKKVFQILDKEDNATEEIIVNGAKAQGFMPKDMPLRTAFNEINRLSPAQITALIENIPEQQRYHFYLMPYEGIDKVLRVPATSNQLKIVHDLFNKDRQDLEMFVLNSDANGELTKIMGNLEQLKLTKECPWAAFERLGKPLPMEVHKRAEEYGIILPYGPKNWEQVAQKAAGNIVKYLKDAVMLPKEQRRRIGFKRYFE